jgi:SM-20-related protein
MSGAPSEPREIDVCVRTIGGHEVRLRLREDAAELRELFTAFVNRPCAAPGLVQLPLDGGKTACTVAVEHIVSIVTSPPVLVQLEQQAPQETQAPLPATAVEPPRLHRPGYAVIDDFLGVDEHQDMLALALRDRSRFEAGTVEGSVHPGRRNSVILTFGETAHATLIANRLLVWFPLLAQALGEPVFPLQQIESQLTASNDGDFYSSHLDSSVRTIDGRAIACVYYFFRQPKGFTGGALRLYDTIEEAGQFRQAESFQEIEPVSNRLVVFTSRTFHELRPTRCPSKDFADSRFAVTTWLHRSRTPLPHATFGWGHFRCGQVAPAFQRSANR